MPATLSVVVSADPNKASLTDDQGNVLCSEIRIELANEIVQRYNQHSKQ
jgi:hypothetical protein